MDLFAVDTWASDKVTDDLNSQLFGEVRVSDAAKSKSGRSEKKDVKGSKKKIETQPVTPGDGSKKTKRNRKRKGSQLNSEIAPVEVKKRSKSSAQAEVVETNCEAKNSPGFKGFLGNGIMKEGISPSAKKRKPSSKKNKYKHLDDIRNAQIEGENSNEDKVVKDIRAKLTNPVLEVRDTEGTDQTMNHTPVMKKGKKGKTKIPDDQDRGTADGNNVSQMKPLKNKKKRKSENIIQQTSVKMTKKLKTQKTTVDEFNPTVHEESEVKKGKERKKRKVNGETARDDIPSKKKKLIDTKEEDNDSKKGKKKMPAKKCPFNTNQLKDALVRETNSTPRTESVQKDRKRIREKTMSLRDRMMEKLNSARFRFLNEQLYSIPGHEALQMMQEDETAFEAYHQGFQHQVEKWPENPVDRMIAYIKKRPGHVVADFGCGEAKISQSIRNKVHSFDLVATNDYVTACDMANVPLPDKSVDIAVFCLSLMGTNVEDFLAEAHRILKKGGNLLIAEVVSRFENTKKFTRKVERMGFTLLSEDLENKMFVWFELKKTGEIKGTLPSLQLAPCVYKKR